MGVGWGTVLGRSGIGGGIREWNVEFILLGAQLFILIFPVSCCIFLILGINPDSTSLTVAERGKGRYCGLQSCSRAHHHWFPLLQAAKMDKEKSGLHHHHQRNASSTHQIHSVPIHG